MYSGEQKTFSPEIMNQLKIAVYCGILPIICIVGAFGNALTFTVFYKEKKKTSTTLLLLGLALADELCVLGQGVLIFIQIRNLYFKKQLPFLDINTFFLSRVAFSLESISKTLTVVIVMERCLAVFRPFHVHMLCSKRVGIFLTISVYFVTLTSCSVELVQISVTGDNSSNSTYDMALVSASNHGAFFGWYGVVLQFVYGIMTVLLIMGLNVAIMAGIRKNVKNTKEITDIKYAHRWKRQRKITKMLLTMSITYVVCCLPNDVCYVLLICDKHRVIAYEGNYYFQATLLFTYCLAVLNNAVNFLVYALTAKTMRRKYTDTLFCCRDQHGKRHYNSSELSIVVTTHL